MELLLPPVLALLPLVVLVLAPWTYFAVAELFERFPRVGLRRAIGLAGLALLVAYAGVVLYLAEAKGGGEEVLFLGAMVPMTGWLVIGPVMFCGMWVREFRLMMSRRDDEFPGRFDKLAWIFALTLLAPAGVWMFRSFRLVRWPPTPVVVDEGDEFAETEVA